MFETDSEQVLWRKDAKDFEKVFLKKLEGAGREVSWTSFALRDWRTTLAFMSVSALLLALSVRTSSLVNLTFCVGRIECVHASGDLQMDCVQTPSYWSDSSLQLFDSWRSFLTTWSRSTRLETRAKESNMCASFLVSNLQAQCKWMLGYVHLQPTVILRVVWVRAWVLGPEGWWTVLVKVNSERNFWATVSPKWFSIGPWVKLFRPSGRGRPLGRNFWPPPAGTSYLGETWQKVSPKCGVGVLTWATLLFSSLLFSSLLFSSLLFSLLFSSLLFSSLLFSSLLFSSLLFSSLLFWNSASKMYSKLRQRRCPGTSVRFYCCRLAGR